MFSHKMGERENAENTFNFNLIKSLEESLGADTYATLSGVGIADEEQKTDAGAPLHGVKSLSQSASPLLDIGQMSTDDPSICPYCNKKFRKPRVLDCLHSMCEDCIIAQLGGDNDSRRNTNQKFGRTSTDFELEQNPQTLRPTPPGVIRCPVCSQETHIGNDVMFVNLMLLDFVRIREIGLNDRIGERICRCCKGEEAAIANCLHCYSDLCNKCVQAHRDMRMFDGHKVMMFSEINKTTNESVKNDKDIKLVACTKHKNDFVAVCFACDELLCKECVDIGEHYSHSWSMLNENVGKILQQDIQKLAKQAETKGKATLDARESIPERKELLIESSKKCREKIEETFHCYSLVLNEVKIELLAELDRNRDEKDEYLDGLYQKIDLETSKLQDALNYTGRLLDKGTVVDWCLNKKKVWTQLRLLMHSMPDANAEVDLDFDALLQTDFKKKLESIVGSIKCRITGIPKDAKSLTTPEPTKIEGIVTGMSDMAFNHGHVSTPSSIWDNNKMSQASSVIHQNPGTIGMERRMNRNSNGNGQSYLSADSGNYSISEMTISSPVSNSIASSQFNTPAIENFNMGRIGSESYTGFRTPTNFLNDTDNANNTLFAENYLSNSQAKYWGTNFNSQSMFPHFDGTPAHRPRDLMESRFSMNEFSSVYGNPELSGMRSRSSLCNTPIDHFTSSNVSQQQDFTAISGRSHSQFSPSASALDMTLNKHFNADKNNSSDTFNTPQGICLGLDTEVAIADTNNHRCIVVNFNDGTFVRSIGSSGTEEGSVYYPKKVVSLIRGRDCLFIVLDRGSNQLFNRLQLFKNNGEYIARLVPPCSIDQVTVMAMNKENEQLVIIDNKNAVHAFEFETFNQLRLIRHFSISGYVHEASDIAIYKGQYYITDYKTHCVVIYSLEGKQVGKFGGLNITPYPVGIDFSKSGDILVGDSHGNHYHVVVFNILGHPLHHYRCHLQKVSRCTGLKITADGRIVTLSRQSSSVLVFNTLFMPTT